LEAATRALFDLGDQSSTDFSRPAGEAALSFIKPANCFTSKWNLTMTVSFSDAQLLMAASGKILAR
jgi:hypothetical protein